MKRFGIFILTLALVFQLAGIFAFAAEESGSPKHITRVVSVIFDDSGSMYKDTDRWAYASYAMQAFTAMMGEDDVLYITYINATKNNGREVLSRTKKQETLDSYEKTMFGGGTKNRINAGISDLESAYSEYGANAKYYLVLMVDGELDPGQGDYSTDLPDAVSKAANRLSGAEFEAYYFFMGGKDAEISGVKNKSASTGNEIVNSLRDISSDIMGRTNITQSCKVSDGVFNFDLKYPALGITLFVQKANVKFENVDIPISKDGKTASYDVDTYYLDCPSSIVKNPDATIYNEAFPKDPPGGFVSLVSDGSSPLPKGSYSIDLSDCGVKKDDVVILVEPAVKIGCTYSVGDSDARVDFSEIKDVLRAGDTVTVRCGLYEMKADGSLGDPVPDDILSPEYELYVNDTLVTTKVSSEKNAYEIKIAEEYENKEIKIVASLEGYQPFVKRERFGKFVIKPAFDPGDADFVSEVTLTKPLWKDWCDGEGELIFPLKNADSSILKDLEIKVSGCDALPSGICSALSDAVKIDGNSIVYSPTPAGGTDFAALPDSFGVSLYDAVSSSELASVKINVVQPKYSFEVENQLEGSDFNLAFLQNNTKYVKFKLMADYGDGSGAVRVGESDCEGEIALSIEHGELTGEEKADADNAEISFVPSYDAEVNSDVAPSVILGKDHEVFAVATVDGVKIESQKISFAINNVDYQIHIENGITEAFTLDTIKSNSNSVVFKVVADYDGNGSYETLAHWDSAVCDKLVIDSGSLPGVIETQYDAGGNAIGKIFTPKYDENNNNGIVFTEVAGRVHTVKGSIEQYSISNETTVEVLAPDYDISVRKDGIKLIDFDLCENQEGVEFEITRNGRPLNAKELAGLAPYDITLSKNQKTLRIIPRAMESSDESGYLLCIPVYDVPMKALLNWTSLFRVRDGKMEIRLTLGEDTAAAAVDIGTNGFAWIILLVVLAIILFISWIVFCYLTRMRFTPGAFYKATFYTDPSGDGWILNSCEEKNANSGKVKRFFRGSFLVPFANQKRSIYLDEETASFETVKTSNFNSYPHWKTKDGYIFNLGILSNIETILFDPYNDECRFHFSDIVPEKPTGTGIEIKMDYGQYLCENNEYNNEKTIIFYVSRNKKKELEQIYGD